MTSEDYIAKDLVEDIYSYHYSCYEQKIFHNRVVDATIITLDCIKDAIYYHGEDIGEKYTISIIIKAKEYAYSLKK